MKVLNKLMVVIGLSAALVGCGNPDMLSSSSIKWSPEATEYLNQRLERPKGAKSEWAMEVKNENGIRMVRVFIDGQTAGWLGCNPGNGVVDKSAWPVCDVIMHNSVNAIHWSESEGYRVGGDTLPGFGGLESFASGEDALAMLNGLRPMFKIKGVIY